MLSMFLEHIAGFDSVDDESALERKGFTHHLYGLSSFMPSYTKPQQMAGMP